MKTTAEILERVITSTDDFPFSSNAVYDARYVLLAMRDTIDLFDDYDSDTITRAIYLCNLFTSRLDKLEK